MQSLDLLEILAKHPQKLKAGSAFVEIFIHMAALSRVDLGLKTSSPTSFSYHHHHQQQLWFNLSFFFVFVFLLSTLSHVLKVWFQSLLEATNYMGREENARKKVKDKQKLEREKTII